MGLTGRYDFKGFQRAVGLLIDGLLAGTSWGAWLLASPFKPLLEIAKNLIINWIANHGLIVLNVGANIIDGKIDQSVLDAAVDAALEKLKIGRDKITPEAGKAIDDDVRKAFDRDADISAANFGVPDVSAPPVRSGNNPSL
jgi:hypothetical protein